MNLLILAGSFIPKNVLIVLIALGVVIACAVVVNIVFIVKIKKTKSSNKKTAVEPIITQDEGTQNVEETQTETDEEVGVFEDTNTAEDTNMSEDVDDVEEREASDVLVVDGKKIMVNFNRSFVAKLIQAAEETKEFYASIKNYLLSFKGVKCRISWKAATFNVGRKQLAKLTVRGKTLNVNLALNPTDYTGLKFKTVDKSESKTYARVPLGFKVKSNRGVLNTKKLIDKIARSLGLISIENTDIAKATDYAYEETDALITKGLIKVKSITGEEITKNDSLISKPFNIHQKITVEQAHAEITDEVAMTLVVEGSENKAVGKKYAVNIDVLSSNFNANDTVDIDALKEKGVVPKKETAIKILARGSLDKPLTVIADDYSTDAIKMIVLVGGTAKLR